MLRDAAKRVFGAYVNPSRIHLDTWVAQAAASVSPGARVLDAGAGEALYKHHFQHVEYHTTDFGLVDKRYAKLDYIGDLSTLPVGAGTYDLVLCTQVLEHVTEPLAVLREFHRVLKTGGYLWLSAPLLYEEHEQPYDFYRYTQFALRHLLREAGFSVCQLEWMEGYYGTLSYQLHFASMNLSGTGRSLGRILVALALEIAARWCTQADLRQRVTTYGMPINYCVVASRLDRAAD